VRLEGLGKLKKYLRKEESKFSHEGARKTEKCGEVTVLTRRRKRMRKDGKRRGLSIERKNQSDGKKESDCLYQNFSFCRKLV
jgi:hypothetical protein